MTTAVSGPSSGCIAGDHARDLVRLERDDDVVLRAELGRIVGGVRPDGERLAVGAQRQAALAHRGQMRPAGDQRRRRRRPAPAARRAGRRWRRRRRCRSFIASSPSFCGEADALQLAGGALRDLGEDHHLARHLEVGEAARRRSRGAPARPAAMPSRSTTARRDLLAELVVRHGEGDHLRPRPGGPSAPRRPRAG